MIDHIVFLTYIILFILSTIGHGFILSNIMKNECLKLNIGYQGLIGFFSLSLISIITSFFIPHNYIHNGTLHFIGIFFFFRYVIKLNKLKELKNLFLIIFCFSIAFYVFKNHDDFPYYHLTYSLNLSENSFTIGTGIFNYGFRTFSSLFYFHSLLYMPLIEIYLFHIGAFFILVFFNFVIISKIYEMYSKNKFNFIYYFSLLSFIFINIVFYRIAEHGTDRSAQILLILIFIFFFEILFFYEKEKLIQNLIILSILIFLASSMKAIYYLYLVLIPVVVFKSKIKVFLNIKKNTFLVLILSSSLFLNLITNYFNTGCFLYPSEKTCIIKSKWSIDKKEVAEMAVHYEWWSKAGGGPGYRSEIAKEEYVKNFVWLKNWIDRHFFNKVSDTLGGIILISIIVISSFRIFSDKSKKFKIKNKYLFAYFFPLVFLIEWFLNHPAMRYGGYVLFAIPIFLYGSSLIENFKLGKKKIKMLTIFFVILTMIIFNVRNIVRLNKEINFYGYNIFSSPFYFVEKVENYKILENNNLTIYSTKNNKMCWATKTPCSNAKNISLDKFLWMNVVLKNDE